MDGMTIGKLAAQAGVGKETVRYYQRRGLIERPQRRAGGGYPVYGPQMAERLGFIRHAQELGFSLREIEQLLELKADPAADCSKVRTRALEKLADVRRKLVSLERMREALEALVAACPGRGALKVCTILDALERDPGAKEARPKVKRGQAMKQITLKVEGMHCEGCAQVVEALLGREDGVQKAAVSYAKREARVLLDPAVTDLNKLAAAIERAGYGFAQSGA